MLERGGIWCGMGWLLRSIWDGGDNVGSEMLRGQSRDLLGYLEGFHEFGIQSAKFLPMSGR